MSSSTRVSYFRKTFKTRIHTSNGIIKSKLGQVASLVGRVEDLIVEDGEVKSQTQSNGVGGGEVGLSDFSSTLVSLKRSISGTLTAIANGELGKVTVVVSLPVHVLEFISFVGSNNAHLVVEDLGLATLGRRNQVLVQNLEDIIADLSKLGFDLLAVLLDEADLRFVSFRLLLLLNRGDDSPRGTTGADYILVGDGEEIPLFDGKFDVGRGNNLHVLDHF